MKRLPVPLDYRTPQPLPPSEETDGHYRRIAWMTAAALAFTAGLIALAFLGSRLG